MRLDPGLIELRAIHAPALLDAAGFRAAAGGIAAINGHYFDPAYKPLGLLVSEGRELSRLRRVDHGIFGVAAGRPFLDHARSFKAPKALEFAIECGPRLVVDGQPLQLKQGVARRTAIGYDGSGRILLIATEGVIALLDLADFAARPLAGGGLAAVGLLNLDGGSSTMFDLHTASRHVAIRSAVEVPVGVVVKRRSASNSASAP